MVSTEPVNKKTSPSLHTSRTNWDDYQIIMEEAVNLNIDLKAQTT
jgi:hypothetical protein